MAVKAGWANLKMFGRRTGIDRRRPFHTAACVNGGEWCQGEGHSRHVRCRAADGAAVLERRNVTETQGERMQIVQGGFCHGAGWRLCRALPVERNKRIRVRYAYFGKR